MLSVVPCTIALLMSCGGSNETTSSASTEGSGPPSVGTGGASGKASAGAAQGESVAGKAGTTVGGAGTSGIGGRGGAGAAGIGSTQGGADQGGAGATQAGGPQAGAAGQAGSVGQSGAAGQVGLTHPFGSHTTPYAKGALLPTAAVVTRDQATATFYDQVWKKKYLKSGCGGRYVKSGDVMGTNGGDTVSEGHGYGMVIVVLMAGHDPDAHVDFDALFSFFQKFRDAQGLMKWTVDVAGGCKVPAGGDDSATDGDLDVAYGLLLASRQWGDAGAINYLAEAKKLVADIETHEMSAKTHLPYLGDWAKGDAKYGPSTRPSDFMVDHFKSFAGAVPAGSWTKAVDAVYTLTQKFQPVHSPATGLFPDFVVATESASPAPASGGFLEGPTDGEYAYNACRVPWRLATDFVMSGDPRAKSALGPMNSWIRKKTGSDPTKIRDGYKLDGAASALQTGPSQAFAAPFGAAAMAGDDQAWVDAMWSHVVTTPSEAYYEDSIKMQVLLLMSQNWWAP